MTTPPHGLRPVLRRDICFGAGTCAVAAPGVFAVDDTHRVVLLDPEAVDADTLQFAVKGCPARALGLADGAGDVLVSIPD